MAITSVYFTGLSKYDKQVRCFKIIGKPKTLEIRSFENGIAIQEAEYSRTIQENAEILVGLFNKDSNFKAELFKAFGCSEDTKFKGIQFKFDAVTILVTKENADVDKIVEEYHLGIKALQLEYEKYKKTPEYKAKRAKELKVQMRKERVIKEMLTVIKDVKLEFANSEAEEKWNHWVKINSNNVYSTLVVKYATQFGKYMQYLMKKHNKPLYLIADNASRITDTMGMSGFSYGLAVSALVWWWKNGNELKKWHNKEWGDENADGVINPAVLTIG